MVGVDGQAGPCMAHGMVHGWRSCVCTTWIGEVGLGVGGGLDGDGEEVVVGVVLISTHAPCHAPTHARPSYPVSPNPILTPPNL